MNRILDYFMLFVKVIIQIKHNKYNSNGGFLSWNYATFFQKKKGLKYIHDSLKIHIIIYEQCSPRSNWKYLWKIYRFDTLIQILQLTMIMDLSFFCMVLILLLCSSSQPETEGI